MVEQSLRKRWVGDSSPFQAFHKACWAERAEIAETFEDDRYRELARRLVFVNAPEALTKSRHAQLQSWLHNRREGRDEVAAGRTLPSALEEFEKLSQEERYSKEGANIRAWLAT